MVSPRTTCHKASPVTGDYGIDRMVEHAAPRRRSVKPEAANGGGPERLGLYPDGGGQETEPSNRQTAPQWQRCPQRFAPEPPPRHFFPRPPKPRHYFLSTS